VIAAKRVNVRLIRSPLWVNLVVLTMRRLLPLFPQLRTCRRAAITDAMCQQATWRWSVATVF
jgi:hypothetical protein